MLWQVSYAYADRVLVTTGSALALGTGLSFISEKSPLSKSLYSSGFHGLLKSRNRKFFHNDHMQSTIDGVFKKTSVFTTKIQHNPENFGAWRSLVARLLWEQDAAGSSPVAPTIREHSSAGRASALQAEGHRFEPCCSHHKLTIPARIRRLFATPTVIVSLFF